MSRRIILVNPLVGRRCRTVVRVHSVPKVAERRTLQVPRAASAARSGADLAASSRGLPGSQGRPEHGPSGTSNSRTARRDPIITAMDVEELLSRAWSAVEKAGLPPELQELAFKEAISFLRAGSGGSQSLGGTLAGEPGGGARKGEAAPASRPDEAAFFRTLAQETGEDEQALRDILTLASDGHVKVVTPTRSLGQNKTEQARNVIALIATARSKGLGEHPVDTEHVRAELQRKQCYDQGNFAATHLGKMKGFNAGANRNQILLTSKWPDEFKAAVAKAQGLPNAGAGS